MRHVHVDVAHLLIHLPHHGDLFRLLQKERRLRGVEQIGGHARRPAARFARIHRKALKHHVIGPLQPVLCEWGEVRIVEVGHAEGRLFARPVGHITMRRVEGHRRRAAGYRQIIGAHRNPPGVVGPEIRRGGILRGKGRGAHQRRRRCARPEMVQCDTPRDLAHWPLQRCPGRRPIRSRLLSPPAWETVSDGRIGCRCCSRRTPSPATGSPPCARSASCAEAR